MTARSRMTMRALVQRDGSTTSDDLNQPAAPAWVTHLEALACYAWAVRMEEIIDAKKTAVVERIRVMIPVGTDLSRADRILSIADRMGATQFSGPFQIDGDPQLRRTHLEISLRAVD